MKINHRKTQLRRVVFAVCLSLGLGACVVHTARRPIVIRATKPAPLARIDISERIQFRPGSAILMSESLEVLEEVVTAMQDNLGILRVEVQGHTDSKGRTRKNRRLSRKRAEAVRDFLVDRGIDRGRLRARGFGPDKPVADNDTREGREQTKLNHSPNRCRSLPMPKHCRPGPSSRRDSTRRPG